MLAGIIAWIPILFAFPSVTVDWASSSDFRISVSDRHELIERCLAGGIEVRYRYRVHYCIRRVGWFDDCRIERTEIRSMRYDAVSETYLVVIDRFGDDKPPDSLSFNSADEAYSKVSTIDHFPLSFLTSEPGAANVANSYVGVRSTVDCKRDFSDVVLDVPYIMTFGLLKTSRFDSGWIAFELQNSGD